MAVQGEAWTNVLGTLRVFCSGPSLLSSATFVALVLFFIRLGRLPRPASRPETPTVPRNFFADESDVDEVECLKTPPASSRLQSPSPTPASEPTNPRPPARSPVSPAAAPQQSAHRRICRTSQARRFYDCDPMSQLCSSRRVQGPPTGPSHCRIHLRPDPKDHATPQPAAAP